MKAGLAAFALLAVSACGSSPGAGSVMSQAEQAADSDLCSQTPAIMEVPPGLTPALAALVQQWEVINHQPVSFESNGTTPIVPPAFTKDLGKIEAWCSANGFGT